ncbi:hypothetical protein ABDK00_017335 [Niabella insulamsoli]|uniref:hypothetical protein n=1 Tax=Niabella insulamsoli TaxID=3144874 RepID=UPI0031FD00D0
MIKQAALFVTFAFAAGQVSAQAFEGKVKYGKAEEPAIVMIYDYPEEIVTNAFTAKFTDKQYRSEESKDFIVYTNAVMSEVSQSKLDYFLKMEEAGRQGSEKTTVYLIMHGSGDIEGAANLGQRAKSFLEKMKSDVERSSTIAAIKKQETLLVDEEDILLKLKNEQKEIEAQLEANKAKQTAQQKIVASQKMIVDDLKAKLN